MATSHAHVPISITYLCIYVSCSHIYVVGIITRSLVRVGNLNEPPSDVLRTHHVDVCRGFNSCPTNPPPVTTSEILHTECGLLQAGLLAPSSSNYLL